jgi:dolichol-phosphate mannosyltransferase
MSGFFAVRRDRVDLDRLRPQGFKILLKILARSSRLRIREVPFEVSAAAQWREQGLACGGLLRKVRITRRGASEIDGISRIDS